MKHLALAKIDIGYREAREMTEEKKDIFTDPDYRGKHIVMIAGKVFATKTGKEAS